MIRRAALLVATQRYQDPSLSELMGPDQDVEALASVLRDPRIAGFHVQVLIDEPHYVVGQSIGEFYRDRRRDDVALLYFTGHGVKDDEGRLYFGMNNTRRDDLLFTAISAEQINSAMESCDSRQKVLILDCCYSGAFPEGRASKGDSAVNSLATFQGRGRAVLTASDSTQYAFEGNVRTGAGYGSVFTKHLVSALRSGEADTNGDGDITVEELYAYVRTRVIQDMPQQRPKRQEDVDGSIVVARNTNWNLPDHLRNALASPLANDRMGAIGLLSHFYRIGNTEARAKVVESARGLLDDDSRAVTKAVEQFLDSLEPQPATDSEMEMPRGLANSAKLEDLPKLSNPEGPSTLDAYEQAGSEPEVLSTPNGNDPDFERQLIGTLLSALRPFAGMVGLYLHPDIPRWRLKLARGLNRIPVSDLVLALLDRSWSGIARDSLIFATSGIYWQDHGDPYGLSYGELSKSSITVRRSKYSIIDIGSVELHLNAARYPIDRLVEILRILGRTHKSAMLHRGTTLQQEEL